MWVGAMRWPTDKRSGLSKEAAHGGPQGDEIPDFRFDIVIISTMLAIVRHPTGVWRGPTHLSGPQDGPDRPGGLESGAGHRIVPRHRNGADTLKRDHPEPPGHL